MKVDGKVVIITGGAKGIGKAIAAALLRHGAKVCIGDVNVSQGNRTVQEFQESFGTDNAMFLKCDVTSQEEMEALFQKTKKKFGGIDIVCNNAGIVNEKRWELTIAINLTAVIRGTLLGIQHLMRSEGGNGGVIINISSGAGLLVSSIVPTYCASKHGVIAFTRSWAQNPDMQKESIRLGTICPSYVDTDFERNMKPEDVYHFEKAQEKRNAATFLQPDDIGDAFMQLVQDDTQQGAVMRITPGGITYQKYSK